MADNNNEQTATKTAKNAELENLAGRYLTFLLDGEFYGIGILRVRELIGVQAITRVPDTEPHIKGVINLRGQVIAVIDLRLKLGLEETPPTEETCTVIVEIDKGLTGMIVDRVEEVVNVPVERLEPAPQFGQAVDNEYIQAMGKIGDRVLLLINTENILKARHTE